MNLIESLKNEVDDYQILAELTGAFEGIASLRVSQIKDSVLNLANYFNRLWAIYRLLKIDEDFKYNKSIAQKNILNKELFIIITSESGFGGDIDLKLIEMMLSDYNSTKNDILVIGYHGAIQLAQRGVDYIKYFKLPKSDQNINTEPLITEIIKYQSTTIYYQEYISLLNQEVNKIDLNKAIKLNIDQNSTEIINQKNYIFEPNARDVARHVEASFVRIALNQKILSSKLAQYASRFKAMSISNQIANQLKDDTKLLYNRTKRNLGDRRLQEIVSAYKISLSRSSS